MSYIITNAKKFIAHSVGKQPVQGEYGAFNPENAGPFQSTWRLFIFGPDGSEVTEYPNEKLLLSALRKIAGDSLKIQSISTLTIEQRDKRMEAGVHVSQMSPTASRPGNCRAVTTALAQRRGASAAGKADRAIGVYGGNV